MEKTPKSFIPLNVSSKFAICGLPIRMDTYKYCMFGCRYCFANNREIMKFDKHVQIANTRWLEKKLDIVLAQQLVKPENFLDVLISNNITFHCGGMSDPFQPCEQAYHSTRNAVDICNKYSRHILFSTKSDTPYDCNIRPDLHTFQLSVTGADTSVEPNVPSLDRRIEFFRQLKRDGFRVGIRLQPFIPGITSLDLVKEFNGADNFTIEGLKIVPQNAEAKAFVYTSLGIGKEQFTQMGLLNLKPDLRAALYAPFIEYFKENNIPFSIADNDMHHLGTNMCCCGDRLVDKSSGIDSTAMCQRYGPDYTKEMVDYAVLTEGYADCKCNQLFTSNRQEGCFTVGEFYDKRFNRKSSIFSPKFLYRPEAKSVEWSGSVI